MQVTMQKEKRYLKEIENLLICDRKKKNEILDSFKNEIDDFLNNNPEAEYTELLEVFGTPQEIANELLTNESAENIKKRLNAIKCIKIGIVIALASLFLCIALALFDAHKAHRGYGKEEIFETIISDIDNTETSIEQE